ncbi:hypothetical protein BDP27DRAFT_1447489 [Rhodocollybia butyracea]|uniref:Uncharacterized protein n=1 Tax=Rhodocollybia butyracea TaxID=206335 RepID=A0A9P5U888_9AGAR|nr:hypothetical protein BDP27DRAFT_1447489 [Rhodocollybia butyracea]
MPENTSPTQSLVHRPVESNTQRTGSISLPLHTQLAQLKAEEYSPETPVRDKGKGKMPTMLPTPETPIDRGSHLEPVDRDQNASPTQRPPLLSESPSEHGINSNDLHPETPSHSAASIDLLRGGVTSFSMSSLSEFWPHSLAAMGSEMEALSVPATISTTRITPAVEPLRPNMRSVITIDQNEYLVSSLGDVPGATLVSGVSSNTTVIASHYSTPPAPGSCRVVFIGLTQVLVRIIEPIPRLFKHYGYDVSSFPSTQKCASTSWKPGMSAVVTICGMEYLVTQVETLASPPSMKELDFSQVKIAGIDNTDYSARPLPDTHKVIIIEDIEYLVWIAFELGPTLSWPVYTGPSRYSYVEEMPPPPTHPLVMRYHCIGNQLGEFWFFNLRDKFLRKTNHDGTPFSTSIWTMGVRAEGLYGEFLVYRFEPYDESQVRFYSSHELFVCTAWQLDEVHFPPLSLFDENTANLDPSSDYIIGPYQKSDPSEDGMDGVGTVRRGYFDVTQHWDGGWEFRLVSDPQSWPTLAQLKLGSFGSQIGLAL